MHIKYLTLNSLPYFVGVASLVVAVHAAAPALRFEDARTETTKISGQIVNRLGKGDRLPIKHAVPLANDTVQTPLAPSREIKNEFEGPIQVG